MTFKAPTCECSHPMADHKSGKSSFPFPRVYGVCFRCDCKAFREVESPDVFIDGNRVTPGTEKCVCGPGCEMPCWQRIGLTTDPCCPGCPALQEDV